MPHLVVIGSTGVFGSAAVMHFLNKGWRVTAFVRNAAGTNNLAKAGAVIRMGDLTQPDTLTGICNGTDVVLAAAHAMLGKGNNKSETVDLHGAKALIDEARKAEVKQFVYCSLNQASEHHPIDFFRTKYQVEQYIQTVGIPYTILRLPAFMEWHAYRLLGKDLLEKGKASIIGAGNNPTNFIATEDLVAALDTIALNPAYINKRIELGGPDNVTRNQVAELFMKASGRQAKISHMPLGMAKALGWLLQPLHPGIARIMRLSVASEHTDETMPPGSTIAQFGLKPTTMAMFVQQKIAANRTNV